MLPGGQAEQMNRWWFGIYILVVTGVLAGEEAIGQQGRPSPEAKDREESGVTDDQGAIIRGDTSQKTIHLAFTGHEFADGAGTVTRTLKKQQVKASFFFTGDFCRRYPRIVKRLKKSGHYIGPHSDKHLLYCDWKNRDSLLVTEAEFMSDLQNNYTALEQLNIAKSAAALFMPPYEWYNATIVEWGKKAGVKTVNFTPGTSSNADYTTPDMPNYRSSETLFNRILAYEKESSVGLNGFHLLIHIGTDPKRKDKLYDRLEELIKYLKQKNYRFEVIK